MKKRAFRPKKPASPSYPLLREVDHNIMSRWGLATLGGLLLGGAACTPARADQPPPGEPPAVRVEKKPDGKAARLPDAGAPAETAVVHLGKPTVPRVDEDKAKADKSAKKKANKKDPKAGKKEHADVAGTGATSGSADTPTKPERTRMITAGVPMRQRIEPPTEDTGKTDVPKGDSAAKHTKGGDQKGNTSTPNKTKTERTP